MSSLVPDGWGINNLDKITRVIDSAHQTPTFSKNGYPMVRVGDIKGGKITLDNTAFVADNIFNIFTKKYTPTFNDLLMTRVGSYGRCSIVKSTKAFCLGQNTVVINPTLVEPDYLYQFLQTRNISEQIEDSVSGSSQKSLSLAAIKSLKVLTPEIKEQKKIATILSAVDEVIEKTQAQIDKLKDLKTGMMQELLTKGVGVDGKPHTEFKDSPLGRIPVGWEVLTMRDICSVRQGLQIPISQRHKVSGKNRYVYLTVRFINTGFDPSVAEYIENPKSNVICDEDDIVLARTGATGKVVTGIKGVFHNNFFMIDYDRKKIFKNYLIQYLNSPFIQNEIKNRAGTTTIPDLNHGDFYSLVMLMPSIEEQTKIAQVLASIDKLLSRKKTKLNSAQLTKKALMQDLLTGKVRVKVTDNIAVNS